MATQTKDIERLAILISTLRPEDELKSDGDRQEEAARRQAIITHLDKHPSIKTPDLLQKLWKTDRFAQVNSEQLKESLGLFVDLINFTWAEIKDFFRDFMKNFKPETAQTMDEATVAVNIRELSKAVFQTLAVNFPHSPAVIGVDGDLWNSAALFNYITDNSVAKADLLNTTIAKRLTVIGNSEDYEALKEQPNDQAELQAFAAMKDISDNFVKAGIALTSDLVVRYALERLRYALYYISEVIQLSELVERKAALALSGQSELDEQIGAQEQKIGTIFTEAVEKYGLEELSQEETVSNLAANFERYKAALEEAEAIFETEAANAQQTASVKNTRTTFPVLDKDGKPVLILTNREYIDALRFYAERKKGNIAVTQNLPLSGELELNTFDFIQTGPVEDFRLTAKKVIWQRSGHAGEDIRIDRSEIHAETALNINTGPITETILSSPNVSVMADGDVRSADIRQTQGMGRLDTSGKVEDSRFTSVIPLIAGKNAAMDTGHNLVLSDLYFMAAHVLGFPGVAKIEKYGHYGWSVLARSWTKKPATQHEVAYLAALLKLKASGKRVGLIRPIDGLKNLEGAAMPLETLDKVKRAPEKYQIVCATETGGDKRHNSLSPNYTDTINHIYRYKIYIAPADFGRWTPYLSRTEKWPTQWHTTDEIYKEQFLKTGKEGEAVKQSDILCIEIETPFLDLQKYDLHDFSTRAVTLGTSAPVLEIPNKKTWIGLDQVVPASELKVDSNLPSIDGRLEIVDQIKRLFLSQTAAGMPELHTTGLSRTTWTGEVTIRQALQTTFEECQLNIVGSGDWQESRITSSSRINVTVADGFAHRAGAIVDSTVAYTMKGKDATLDLQNLQAENSTIIVKTTGRNGGKVNLREANLINCKLEFQGQGIAVDISSGNIRGGSISGAISTLDISGAQIGDEIGNIYTNWAVKAVALTALDSRIGNVQFAVAPALVESEMPSIEIVGAPEFLDGDLEKIATYISLAKNAEGQRNLTAGRAPVVDLGPR